MTTLTVNPPLRRPVRSTAPASSHQPSYRLTRRGRMVVFLFALAAVAALCLAFAAGSGGTTDRHTGWGTKVVVVTPGETLWDVASRASSGGDVRDMMQRIEDLNALPSSQLQAGQRLRVPTED